MPLDADRVVELLGGRADSAVDLFGAIVRTLCGNANVIGEKTPEHLLWWEPLAAAVPGLRFIGIVRDPRAVVASQRHVDWGIRSHALLATQWALDQRELLRARERLGSDRLLIVRYEDMVTDPDETRSRIAHLLGCTCDRPSQVEASSFVLPWEHWKSGVDGPVTRARCDAWRRELSPREADEIVAACADELVELGYADVVEAAPRLSPHDLPEAEGRARLEALHHRRLAGIAVLTARDDWALGGLPPQPVAETPYRRHEWDERTAAAG